MPIRPWLSIALSLLLPAGLAAAQTVSSTPPPVDEILANRAAFCGPKLDQTPALAKYNAPYFCTCMGIQLAGAHRGGIAEPSEPLLTKMIVGCVALSHKNTAIGAKPIPGRGAWVEMAQGPKGITLGWGEPGSDLPIYAVWMVCRPATKTIDLTVELDHGTVGRQTGIWLSKGDQSLLIKDTVRKGPNGPVLERSYPYAGVLPMLSKPDDLVIHGPRAPMRFPNASLPAVLPQFLSDCDRH